MIILDCYTTPMRYQYLDILRWLAIVLMVLFHLNYSLVYIFENETLNFSETFWYILGKISALGFIFISGMSFYLASQKYSREKLTEKYLRYALILALCAWAITLITAIFFPEQLILFGILHFFALSFALLPFITRSRALVIAVIVMIISIYFYFPQRIESWLLFPLGFVPNNFYSADYYPLIPYFCVILWWYLWAEFFTKNNLMKYFYIPEELNSLQKILSHIGKYSLFVYLVHQPFIIGFLYIFLS